MKAQWMKYFDYQTEKYYERPCCPECSAKSEPTPVVVEHDKYVCLNCHADIEVDKKQKKWIDDMRKTKLSVEKCFMCGAYKMVYTKKRNPVTRKWQVSSGVCGNCGCKTKV